MCYCKKEKGLSVINSTANVIEDLNKMGIPIGDMPDGSPNLTIGVEYARWKEIVRTFHEDAKYKHQMCQVELVSQVLVLMLVVL